MWRLRPWTSFPPVEAALAAGLSGLDRLTVQDRRARLGVPSRRHADAFAEDRVQVLPGAILGPLVEVVADGPPIRELLGQQPPLAAGPFQVQQPVEHLAQANRAGPAGSLGSLRRRQQRLQQRPLGIGQVGRVGPAIPQHHHAAPTANSAPSSSPFTEDHVVQFLLTLLAHTRGGHVGGHRTHEVVALGVLAKRRGSFLLNLG